MSRRGGLFFVVPIVFLGLGLGLGLGPGLRGGLFSWPLHAQPRGRTGATLTAARLSPGGAAGRQALLGGELPEDGVVARAVREQGFFAGEPVGSGDCASCHAEIAAQWAQSAHRFASLNNPYYTASLEQLRRERGTAAARFCAGCHDPLLLVDDAIVQPRLPRQAPAAQAGLPCLVCHSIKECQGTLGNGAYTLVASAVPPPATSATAGSPSPHGARLRAAVLGRPELCAACHKVGLLPEVTQAQWLRGQNDYDAWQQSVAAGNGVAAIYRPQSVEVKRCQDCHMPLVKLRSGQLVRSHRFIAANAALAALRDDREMIERTREFLAGAISLDLAVPPPSPAQEQAPSLAAQVHIAPKALLRFDVVLRNRRVGHRFPGGTNDSNDVWLAVEVGVPGGSGLRDATHRVRAQAVDEQGIPLAHRDPQNMRGVVYDTSVAPADPQVVRYTADLSALPEAATAPELVLRARLLYRKFSPDYARFACAELPAGAEPSTRCLEPPVIEIASAERRLLLTASPDRSPGNPARSEPAAAAGPEAAPLWQRYLDHGLGLADGLVEKASEARPSLERAAALAPERPEPLLGLGRLALALGRTQEVLALCERAQKLRPDHPAALWLPALALYRTYRFAEARPYVEQLATRLPTDRSVLTLLSRVRGLTGEPQAALAAADRLLQVDAESEDGHHQRLLALRELGRPAEAAEAERRYLYYRRPVEQDQALRQRFRAREPERIDEDVPAHTHALGRSASAP